MKRRNSIFLLLFLGITAGCGAQNFVKPNAHYDYHLVKIDSTLDSKVDPKLDKYLNHKKLQLAKEMNVVIGHCDQTMTSFAPQSPLSNFLTDLLLNNAAAYAEPGKIVQPDVAILNFGGIRAPLAAGDVTVGDVFAISPFDNHLVFIELTGFELKRVFERFYPNANVACFSGLQVSMADDKATVTMPDGSPILDDHLYTLVTLDFIAEGGDKILTYIRFEHTYLTNVVFRDFIIQEIRKLEAQGKKVTAKLDERIR